MVLDCSISRINMIIGSHEIIFFSSMKLVSSSQLCHLVMARAAAPLLLRPLLMTRAAAPLLLRQQQERSGNLSANLRGNSKAPRMLSRGVLRYATRIFCALLTLIVNFCGC